MAESDAEFVERMSRAIPYNSHLLKAVDLTRLFALARRGAVNPPKGFTAGWVTGRADAAKVAEELANKWAVVWRKGLIRDSHLEGMSDGADDVADAIRALPPPPSGEPRDE